MFTRLVGELATRGCSPAYEGNICEPQARIEP